MIAVSRHLPCTTILLCAALYLLFGSQTANAFDPVQQEIAQHKVAPLKTAALLAGKWEHFPLVSSAKLKLGDRQPVPPVNPPHDGSICSDGWRRLMFNMNPALIQDKRFSGFRFVYDGNPGDDFIFIFANNPLGQNGREWGIITQKGLDVSFTHVLRPYTPAHLFQYKEAKTFVKGQEYLIWFAFEFDYPVQLRFRIAYGQIAGEDTRDFKKLLKAMADPAELELEAKPTHPLTHMGLGITVVKTMGGDKPFLVTGKVNGTPAQKMAISTHSYITHVNGVSVKDMSVEQYHAITQDPKTDSVVLTLRRGLVDRSSLNNPYDVKFAKVFIDGKAYQDVLQSSMHLRFAMTYGGNTGAAFLAGEAEEKQGSYKNAVKMYTKAAENGEVKAMMALGRVYTEGRVEVDQAQATHWYTQAAGQGDINAAYETGKRLEAGLGTKEDLKQAATFYEQAAKGGHMEASTRLGEMYTQGKGVPKDKKRARHWLEQSAFQGNSQAAFGMGQLTIQEGDYAQAKKWFEKAIEGKHIQASIELGKMYEAGLGVTQNDIEAAKWYHRVVVASSEAKYRYALILRKDNRLNNPRISQAQLLLASREGYEPARQLLAKDGLDWTTLKLPSETKQADKPATRSRDQVPDF